MPGSIHRTNLRAGRIGGKKRGYYLRDPLSLCHGTVVCYGNNTGAFERRTKEYLRKEKVLTF